MPYERRYREFDPPTTLTGSGPFTDMSVRANFYLQTLLQTTAEVILTRGDDAVGLMNKVGAGYSILLGSFFGFSALAYRDADGDGDRFLEALLASAGVAPDRCGSLLRRRRVLDDQEAWFYINPTPHAVTETVSISGFSQVSDLLGDSLVSQTGNDIAVHAPGTNLACLLLSE